MSLQIFRGRLDFRSSFSERPGCKDHSESEPSPNSCNQSSHDRMVEAKRVPPLHQSIAWHRSSGVRGITYSSSLILHSACVEGAQARMIRGSQGPAGLLI